MVCYYPYAKGLFKTLPDEESISEEEKQYPNIDEWAESSGILTQKEFEDNGIDILSNQTIPLYNPGDVKTPCKIYCPLNGATSINIQYFETSSTATSHGIQILQATPMPGDIGILIDIGLIQGVTAHTAGTTDFVLSDNLYNKYMKAGHFFKIEPTPEKPTIGETGARITINTDIAIEVYYDYLYY